MITTRDIDVDLEKDKARLDQKTTKDIDIGFNPAEAKKKAKPKKANRPQSISTHNMPDIADVLEKKKRDEIIADMKLAMEDEITAGMKAKEFIDKVKDEKSPLDIRNWKGEDGLEKLNRQFVFIDMFCEEEIQAFPRRELK